MTTSEFRIARADANDLPFVLSLLEECGLPAEGVPEHFARFFVARIGGKRIGCVGIEVYAEDILLRSLAVARRARNAGAGRSRRRGARAAGRPGG
jgi:amino-acid N-acetyltransferase